MFWGCLGGHLIVRTTENGASEILGQSGKSDQTAKNLFKTNIIYIYVIYIT